MKRCPQAVGPLLLLVVAFLPLSVCAASISLSPTADSFVSSALPANNYGGAGALEVSAPGLAKGEFQSLLMFDLASAKSSFDSTLGVGAWAVQSVQLQLTAASPNNAIFNTSAAGNLAASWMSNDSWTEGSGTPAAPSSTGITWNSLPSFLSGSDQDLGTFAFGGATSGNVTYTLNLVSGLVADTSGGSLASIRLSAASGDSTLSALFNSRSFNTVASRPLLTITAIATPEPSTMVLCGLGMLIVCGMRRRISVH